MGWRNFWFKKKINKHTAEGVVGHTEEGEAIGSEYVKYVAILRETHPGVGLRRQFLNNPSGNRPCVPRHGAEFRQYHRSSRHQRVEYRHIWLFKLLSLLL